MLESPLAWLGLVAGGLGAWMLRRGIQDLSAGQELPLLTRPALILDRRSLTEIKGWSGRTIYFFKMEFEDGAQGEFSFPGLGPQEDPYATNLPGVAYTRGQELLYFRHVRV